MPYQSHGGAAFPVTLDTSVGNEGLTIRDYFAAAALAGLAVNFNTTIASASDIAHDAYQLADALLRYRADRPTATIYEPITERAPVEDNE